MAAGGSDQQWVRVRSATPPRCLYQGCQLPRVDASGESPLVNRLLIPEGWGFSFVTLLIWGLSMHIII